MSYVTVRQQQILDFVRSQSDSCTLQQIAEHFGGNVKTVKAQMTLLMRKGLIRGAAEPRSARAAKVEQPPAPPAPVRETVPIPAAPIPAAPSEEFRSLVSKHQVTGKQLEILRMLHMWSAPLKVESVAKWIDSNVVAVQVSLMSLKRKGLVQIQDGVAWIADAAAQSTSV